MPAHVVLTPEFGPRLEAAFAPLAPGWRLDGARIGPQTVEAVVCRGSGECVPLHFSVRSGPCADSAVGAWCARFPDGAPADAALVLQPLTTLPPVPADEAGGWLPAAALWPLLVVLVVAVLAPPGIAVLWRRSRRAAVAALLALAGAAAALALLAAAAPLREALQVALQTAEEQAFEASAASPTASLVGWFALPVAAGAYLAGVRRLALRRRLGSAAAFCLLLAVGPALGVTTTLLTQRLGGWDAMTMGALCSAVLLWLGHAWLQASRKLLLAALAGLVGLGAAEVAARLVLRQPPLISHRIARLLQPRSVRPDGLPTQITGALHHAALYGQLGAETSAVLRLDRPPSRGPWLLHLGDSMVFGEGVGKDDALPGQLARLWPGPVQINAGVPASSLDVHLPLAWRLLQPHSPQLVVLHVMPGNDLDELNQPSEACLDQPTLVAGPPLQLRCPEPRWSQPPLLQRLLRSRPPYPVALLTDQLWLARWAEAASQALVAPAQTTLREPAAAARFYQQLLTALQADCQRAGVPLVAVVWPLRPSVYAHTAAARRQAVLRALAAAGVQSIDTQQLANEWLAQGDETRVFGSSPPGDVHLNRDALAKLAVWLVPQLQSRVQPTARAPLP